MTPLRVVVLGAGRFGALHVRTFIESGATVVGLADLRPDRLAEVAGRHGVERTSTDALALVRDLEPDLVVVATDEATHSDLTDGALDVGAHVLVEKPFAMSMQRAQATMQRARAGGREVVAGHISRFAEPYSALRRAITGGSIGTLWSLRLRRDFSRSWYEDFGGRVNPVWESCIHDVDLALYLTSASVRRVQAMRSEAAGDAAPSVVSALAELDDGVMVTIETAWTIPRTGPHTASGALELPGTIAGEAEAHGSTGVARQRLLSDAYSIWSDDGCWAPNPSLWPVVDGRVGGAMRSEVEYVSAVARGHRPNDRMPMQQAVDGIEVAQAIVDAVSTAATVYLR